jgi:protein-tyrosine phosphatase
MHLPATNQFAQFAKDMALRIQAGEHLAVHCFASIGRSGMLTCAILGHFGFDAVTAISHVSAMRGTSVPDTAQQLAFIHRIIAA